MGNVHCTLRDILYKSIFQQSVRTASSSAGSLDSAEWSGQSKDENDTETGYDPAIEGAKVEDRYYNDKSFEESSYDATDPKQKGASVKYQSTGSQRRDNKSTEDAAATKIQANFRGYKSRKEGNNLKADKSLEETANKDLSKSDDHEVIFDSPVGQTTDEQFDEKFDKLTDNDLDIEQDLSLLDEQNSLNELLNPDQQQNVDVDSEPQVTEDNSEIITDQKVLEDLDVNTEVTSPEVYDEKRFSQQEQSQHTSELDQVPSQETQLDLNISDNEPLNQISDDQEIEERPETLVETETLDVELLSNQEVEESVNNKEIVSSTEIFDDLESRADATIQAGCRGYLTRKQLKHDKESARGDTVNEAPVNSVIEAVNLEIGDPGVTDESAALKIQSHYRGYRVRKDMASHRDQESPKIEEGTLSGSPRPVESAEQIDEKKDSPRVDDVTEQVAEDSHQMVESPHVVDAGHVEETGEEAHMDFPSSHVTPVDEHPVVIEKKEDTLDDSSVVNEHVDGEDGIMNVRDDETSDTAQHAPSSPKDTDLANDTIQQVSETLKDTHITDDTSEHVSRAPVDTDITDDTTQNVSRTPVDTDITDDTTQNVSRTPVDTDIIEDTVLAASQLVEDTHTADNKYSTNDTNRIVSPSNTTGIVDSVDDTTRQVSQSYTETDQTDEVGPGGDTSQHVQSLISDTDKIGLSDDINDQLSGSPSQMDQTDLTDDKEVARDGEIQ